MAAKRTVSKEELEHEVRMEEAILSMPIEFLQCRKLGHSWKTFDADYHPDEHYFEEKVRCSSCKGVKTLYMDEGGEYFEGTKYLMKAGYHTKGLGRMTGHDRSRVRISALRQFIDQKNKKKR